jgi:O-acetyl-ADP-ribose deacetylase (regulator of RNase III)
MTVKIIKGDMVVSYKNNELDAYAHQANCFCTMKRGIAPLLVKANHSVGVVDRATVSGDRNKLGTFTKTPRTNCTTAIYNIYGQYHWSKYKVAPNRNTDYEALKKGLSSIMWDVISSNYDKPCGNAPTLGLPLIGCGLAGGDWEGVVLPMIKELFENSGVGVTVFVL